LEPVTKKPQKDGKREVSCLFYIDESSARRLEKNARRDKRILKEGSEGVLLQDYLPPESSFRLENGGEGSRGKGIRRTMGIGLVSLDNGNWGEDASVQGARNSRGALRFLRVITFGGVDFPTSSKSTALVSKRKYEETRYLISERKRGNPGNTREIEDTK